MEKVRLINVNIDKVSMKGALDRIEELIRLKKNAYVVTPNVNHLIMVRDDSEFKQLYDEADLSLLDGTPLLWAAKLLKKPLTEKVSGSDLVIPLCALAEKKGYRIFIMAGDTPELTQQIVQKLKTDFPHIQIVGAESPVYGFEKDEAESRRLAQAVQEARTDILFVGVGAPKQEKWIYKHKDECQAHISLAIGASFNFYIGHTKRAPVWMQKYGLEGWYRFMHEPRRLFRRVIIENMQFFSMLFKEYMQSR